MCSGSDNIKPISKRITQNSCSDQPSDVRANAALNPSKKRPITGVRVRGRSSMAASAGESVKALKAEHGLNDRDDVQSHPYCA